MSTPARSAKDAWANLSNSATKPRSSTTPTGSSSTTTSRSGTRQTPPSWPRRSHGSPDAPDAHRARSPPTAATAKHRWNATCTNSAYAAWRSRAKANPAPRAASSNTAEPSATRSNGAPDPKDGSTTSNEATAGTAPNSPASAEPEAGADTASSLTTSSRSGPSPHETHTRAARAAPDRHPQSITIAATKGFSGRSS